VNNYKKFKMKILKKIMIISITIIGLIAAGVWFFMQHPKFGTLPDKNRIEAFQNSPNFKEGSFQNLHPTQMMTTDEPFVKQLYEFLFKKKPRLKPEDIIPSVKTNLSTLSADENSLVWFGHSSYFLLLDGKKILVDPVLSGAASPVSFLVKAFDGTDIYTATDIPEIDYLLITHDHWDHLDYETILELKPKIKQVFCGLGVGAHLEHWGYNPNIITEMDWGESKDAGNGFLIHSTPARHFSGRGLTRNKALWLSFVLQTPTTKIFIGSDSGYDTHFKSIGDQFGPFDLAILENGQYNQKWKYIHMFPAQGLQAAKDLKAKQLFPVHSGKFSLAEHPWDEPLSEIVRLNKNNQLRLLTPIIGEKVSLNDSLQKFTNWWEGLY